MNKIALIVFCVSIFFTLMHAKSSDDAKGLEIGTMAPKFSALDADEHTVYLDTLLKQGPVVVVFYRGHWCPVCNKHLKALQDSLEQIESLGATVLAISPQKPEFLTKMAKKTKAKFPLLFDDAYEIMNDYDVTFNPPAKTTAMYNIALGAKLKESQSDDSQRLPVPATYIINTNGVIVWRQFDTNYKNRSSVKEIKRILSTL